MGVADEQAVAFSDPRPTLPLNWWSWLKPNRSAFSITIVVAFATSMPTSITVVATSTSASPARKRRIAASLSAVGIWPCNISKRSPFSGPFCNSSKCVLTDFASLNPSSSICGSTMYACRPFSAWRRTNPYAFSACFCGKCRVSIGCRPGGSVSIVLTSKSARYDSASVRGIGVAVMTR